MAKDGTGTSLTPTGQADSQSSPNPDRRFAANGVKDTPLEEDWGCSIRACEDDFAQPVITILEKARISHFKNGMFPFSGFSDTVPPIFQFRLSRI